MAGRYTETGEFQMVGRTGPLTSRQAADLAAVLVLAGEEHPWPTVIGSGHFGGGTVTLTRVVPTVVVEVAADAALSGGRPRHQLRFLRFRPDLTVADIEDAGWLHGG